MTVDKARMARYMSSAGTNAEASNVIAEVVSDVWRAHFGDEWLPFSVRYGIAFEVQRRLAEVVSPVAAETDRDVRDRLGVALWRRLYQVDPGGVYSGLLADLLLGEFHVTPLEDIIDLTPIDVKDEMPT